MVFNVTLYTLILLLLTTRLATTSRKYVQKIRQKTRYKTN